METLATVSKARIVSWLSQYAFEMNLLNDRSLFYTFAGHLSTHRKPSNMLYFYRDVDKFVRIPVDDMQMVRVLACGPLLFLCSAWRKRGGSFLPMWTHRAPNRPSPFRQ